MESTSSSHHQIKALLASFENNDPLQRDLKEKKIDPITDLLNKLTPFYDEKDRSRSPKKLLKRAANLTEELKILTQDLMINHKEEKYKKLVPLINRISALKLLAVEKGGPEGLYSIGRHFMHGNVFFTANFVNPHGYGFFYYQQAAEMGNLDALYQIACHYLMGKIVAKNVKHAIILFEHAAKEGHLESIYFLSKAYLTGSHGIERNPEKGVALLQKAIEMGIKHPRIKHNLGVCYNSGIGVKKDHWIAAEYFQQAANAETEFPASFYISESLNNLELKYQNGDGLPEDAAKQISILRQNARKGNTMSQDVLEEMVNYGLIPPNYSRV